MRRLTDGGAPKKKSPGRPQVKKVGLTPAQKDRKQQSIWNGRLARSGFRAGDAKGFVFGKTPIKPPSFKNRKSKGK